jgi:hypothetical protein
LEVILKPVRFLCELDRLFIFGAPRNPSLPSRAGQVHTLRAHTQQALNRLPLSGQTHVFHFEFGTASARDYIQRPGPYILVIFWAPPA